MLVQIIARNRQLSRRATQCCGVQCRAAVWCWSADKHLKLLDRVVSGARFLTWGEFECDIALLIVYSLLDQVLLDEPSLWCSTCAVCASVDYTQYSGSTLGYLCAFSLQNLAVEQDLLFSSQGPCRTIHVADPLFDGGGRAGFKNRANTFLIGLN